MSSIVSRRLDAEIRYHFSFDNVFVPKTLISHPVPQVTGYIQVYVIRLNGTLCRISSLSRSTWQRFKRKNPQYTYLTY